MIAQSQSTLIQALAELGRLYPTMRFGQLLLFACSMAGDQVPAEIHEPDDTRVLGAIENHMRERAEQVGTDFRRETVDTNSTRTSLLQELRELKDLLADDQTLGRLVSNIADLAGLDVYHTEDQDLLQAARKYPVTVSVFDITWHYSNDSSPCSGIAVLKSRDEIKLDFKWETNHGEYSYGLTLKRDSGNRFIGECDVQKGERREHVRASCTLEPRREEYFLNGDSWIEHGYKSRWSARLVTNLQLLS